MIEDSEDDGGEPATPKSKTTVKRTKRPQTVERPEPEANESEADEPKADAPAERAPKSTAKRTAPAKTVARPKANEPEEDESEAGAPMPAPMTTAKRTPLKTVERFGPELEADTLQAEQFDADESEGDNDADEAEAYKSDAPGSGEESAEEETEDVSDDVGDSEEEVLHSRTRTRKKAVTPASKRRKRTVSTPAGRKLTGNRITPATSARKTLNLKSPAPLPTASGRVEAVTAVEFIREQLHVSHVPEDLPGREEEFANIYQYLKDVIENGGGDCIYVSGVPGTGKTATVRQVIKTLELEVADQTVEPFDCFEVNCMKILEPAQAYSVFWGLLNPGSPKIGAAKAADLLMKRFKTSSTKRGRPIILILDELDLLMTKSQSVIYNFFDWPRSPNSNLAVIAIANTMDLPERMFAQKVNSRVGTKRVTFDAYTVPQLMGIIEARVGGFGEGFIMQRDAGEFCARKVAGMSGDARRALDIVRRTVEVFEAMQKRKPDDDKPPPKSITRQLLNSVIIDMFTSTAVMAVRNASEHQHIVMVALATLSKRLGRVEATMEEVRREYANICQRNNLEAGNYEELMDVLMRLFSCRLILVEMGKVTLGNSSQKVRLNISETDLRMGVDNVNLFH
ncbi:Origin recognition complex, subunit 1 [Irineochytrium annulatum]|nr:Origin recognition complex, subunit 1 [Irineochytrium annulatum]